MNKGYFLLTSNVDNMFKRTGFKQTEILEMHGNIFNLQCFDCQLIFNLPDGYSFRIDHDKFESCDLP